jgi:uncharacterized protein YceK
MENKNIRLIIVAIMAFTILTTGCSISITRNYSCEKPKTPIKTDSTTYAVKLGSHLPKPNYEQK